MNIRASFFTLLTGALLAGACAGTVTLGTDMNGAPDLGGGEGGSAGTGTTSKAGTGTTSSAAGGGSIPASACSSPAATTDGGSEVAACNTLVADGPCVLIAWSSAAPPDDGLGGTIVDGTYDLTATTIYRSPPPAPTTPS